MQMNSIPKKDDARKLDQAETPRLLLNMKTFRNEWEIVGSKKLLNLRNDCENTSDPQINDDLKLKTNINDPHVEKVYDEDLRGFCYEIGGSGIHITIPSTYNKKAAGHKASLHIQSQFLLVLIKSLGADHAFELGVKDSQSVVRRIRFLSPTTVVKTRNSQFTHNIHLPSSVNRWQLYYINLRSLMRSCFQQDFRFLHSMQVSSTLRIKAIWASAADPIHLSSAELLQHLMLNHWPGGAEQPKFVYLSSAPSPGPMITRPNARQSLMTARSADAQIDRPTSASSNNASSLHSVRPQTQGEVCSNINSAASTITTVESSTKNAPASELPHQKTAKPAQTPTGSVAVAPWEQELYATIDLCEPPPSRKGMDSQNEEVWTPSLDAVIEEDHQRNTADTVGGDDESVGSEGEIRRVMKAALPSAPVKRHGVAGCKTIL